MPDEALNDDGLLRMSVWEHLEELRARILRALTGFGVAFLGSMFFAVQLWEIAQRPLRVAVERWHGEIIAIDPLEQFSIIWMWTPLVAAVFVSAPWILYQAWAFVAPGLYPKERRWAAPFLLSTGGLFLC